MALALSRKTLNHSKLFPRRSEAVRDAALIRTSRLSIKNSVSTERRWNNLEDFKDFYLEAKARLSYVCHIVGGGVRIHPENARKSGRHGVQYVAQCVACAALTPVVWQ